MILSECTEAKLEKIDQSVETGNHSNRDWEQVEAELQQLSEAFNMASDILRQNLIALVRLERSLQELQ